MPFCLAKASYCNEMSEWTCKFKVLRVTEGSIFSEDAGFQLLLGQTKQFPLLQVTSELFCVEILLVLAILPKHRLHPQLKKIQSDMRQLQMFQKVEYGRGPATDSILMPPTFPIARLNVIPQTFQGYPRSWPGVKSLASRSSQSEVMHIFVA